MEEPSSFLNAFTLQPGSTTMTDSGRQSSSAPRVKMASMRRSAWSRVIIGSPRVDEGAEATAPLPFLIAAMRIAVHSQTFRQRCPVYTPIPCTDSRARLEEPHMTEFSRRTMLSAAGGVIAAAAATDGLADGQPPFG